MKSAYSRILKLLTPYKSDLALGLIALTLGSLINLLFPYLIKNILNGQYGALENTQLTRIAVGFVLLFLFQAVFFYFRHYCFAAIGYKLVNNLRCTLYNALCLQDISFFDRSRVGDHLSRLSADTEVVQKALTTNVSVALRYLVQVVGGLGLMCFISIRLTGFIVILVPLIMIAGMYWGKKLKAISRKMQEELAETTVIAEETLSATKTVRLFAGTTYEVGRYREAIASVIESGLLRSRIAALFSSSMVFVMHSSIALVICYGAGLVLNSQMSIGDLTAFLLYCIIVAISFGFLANTWTEFMQAVGASERIFEILDSHPQISDPKKIAQTLVAKSPVWISFDRVSFSYPSRLEQRVLNELSFEIKPGETVALVGPSGSGKSTIAALLPRFYEPDSGEIRFCGEALNKFKLQNLRDQISIVPQQPFIFSVSIEENIAYGRLTASREEIESAAKAANIHDFICSLKDGYQTLVGDKGILLSGGERQRIAIARALLKKSSFLILDEATSSLDSENEYLVQQALERLMQGKTTLVIAHRLSTVQHADKVLVLENGQIVQTGTHSELINIPGLYQTFVEHQLLK